MLSVADNQLRMIILAGGEGSRLGGTDKANLIRKGQSLLTYWRDMAQALGLPVSISRKKVEQADEFADDPGLIIDAGPIGGLAAACHNFTETWLLTVPVDTVQLPPDLLARFLELPLESLDSVVVRDATGPQPLLAFWRRTALLLSIERSIAKREFAIRRLHGTRCQELVFEHFECGNLNTPADLQRFSTIIP